MVNPHQSTANFRASQVINSQVSAALVFVFQPAETLGLAGFFVADEFEEDGLAELGEDCDYVAFGEFVGETAKVDVCCVAVVDVPGSVWRAMVVVVSLQMRPRQSCVQRAYSHAVLDLLLVQRLDRAYLVHRSSYLACSGCPGAVVRG
jgi:hypothetical protein